MLLVFQVCYEANGYLELQMKALVDRFDSYFITKPFPWRLELRNEIELRQIASGKLYHNCFLAGCFINDL